MNQTQGFPAWSETKWPLQKMARFLIVEAVILYYLRSKNKSADQLCSYCITDLCLFASAKICFSYDAALILLLSDPQNEKLCGWNLTYSDTNCIAQLKKMGNFYLKPLWYS